MKDFTINANIIISDDDTYYQANLHCLPNIGDLIRLNSAVDRASGHPDVHYLEVKSVLHDVWDVSEKTNPPSRGEQFVSVFTRRVSPEDIKKLSPQS